MSGCATGPGFLCNRCRVFHLSFPPPLPPGQETADEHLNQLQPLTNQLSLKGRSGSVWFCLVADSSAFTAGPALSRPFWTYPSAEFGMDSVIDLNTLCLSLLHSGSGCSHSRWRPYRRVTSSFQSTEKTSLYILSTKS